MMKFKYIKNNQAVIVYQFLLIHQIGVFQIESIQEEQNEIDSINNSSSRFQQNGPIYPNQDADFIQGGYSNYDQEGKRHLVQDQIQQLYAQQKNLNYMNNNTITPVQMYMKEKLLNYQNNQNNVNSGSLIIHNEKLNNSSQLTNTIDKNLEQYYNQLHSQNIVQSDGYEYSSPQVMAPQRLFQKSSQLQSQQNNLPQVPQQQQQIQQFQQMPINGNSALRDNNQKIQSKEQFNVHEQLLDPLQQLQYQEQQINNVNYFVNNFLNNHHTLDNHQHQLNNVNILNSHVGQEINLNNPYSQNINNSLRQSNLSSGGQSQSQKDYFLINPAFESVKKIQDKLQHRNEKPQQVSPKKKKKQDGKEISPEKINQQDSKGNNNDGSAKENQNQLIHQVQSPKHIYLSLQTLNSTQKYKRKQENVNNQNTKKNQTPQKKIQNQKSKIESSAPSRASQSSMQTQSQICNQNSESQPSNTNPTSSIVSKQNSIITPKNGQNKQARNSGILVNDQIDEQCKFSEEQIKILNKSDEKKKVVNSIMNSKRSFLEVRSLNQKELMKQMMLQQQKQQDIINNQYEIRTNRQEKSDLYGLKSKAINNQKELNKLHAAQQRVTLSNKQLSNRKPAQSLNVSKSLPQFITQESLANSAKERQNFEFVNKEDKTVEIKSKENSFAASSSHFQSKMGSPQSGSVMQSKLHNQSTASSYGQTNYFGIMTSPKTKLGESNFYQKESILERNDFWLEHTSSHKQLLNLHYINEEMKECSFSPVFFTNNIHKQCVVKHQNDSTRIQQSLNPTFHKQATSMKQSYSKLHNFKKQMGFIGQQPDQQVHTSNHYQQ